MPMTTDIPDKIEALYEEQQTLKDTQILDADMFQDGVMVRQEDLTLHELIDGMLSGTVDLALRDDVLNKVFHRFYETLPTHEHLAVFRRKFDAELNARWPLRIHDFEDLRSLITLGGQDALYKYGDALFYLQQMRRDHLEEKQKLLAEQQDSQTRAEEQKALSDEAFEAWLAVVFLQYPDLLNQYQGHYEAQSEEQPENDPVSDTLATPPLEESVMEDDSYVPDKDTQQDIMQFVNSRLETGDKASGYSYDYEQDAADDVPDQANDFEQAADPVPNSADLTYG